MLTGEWAVISVGDFTRLGSPAARGSCLEVMCSLGIYALIPQLGGPPAHQNPNCGGTTLLPVPKCHLTPHTMTDTVKMAEQMLRTRISLTLIRGCSHSPSPCSLKNLSLLLGVCMKGKACFMFKLISREP